MIIHLIDHSRQVRLSTILVSGVCNRWIGPSKKLEMDDDDWFVTESFENFPVRQLWIVLSEAIEQLIQDTNNFLLMWWLTTLILSEYKCKLIRINKYNHWQRCYRSLIASSFGFLCWSTFLVTDVKWLNTSIGGKRILLIQFPYDSSVLGHPLQNSENIKAK